MRLGHDAYFLALLDLARLRSTCLRRRVGAVIVDGEHHVLSTGYNGVPSRFIHCTDYPCAGALDPSGDTSRCMAVHAEVNAILQCTRLDLARTLYVSCTPCFSCAKMLVNTPIRRIVTREIYPDTGLDVLNIAKFDVQLMDEVK